MAGTDLSWIASIAARAPSPHNTQPWKLTFSENEVHLGFDPERHLKASDPTLRDLLLALGGFVESFLIASCEVNCALEFAPEIDLDRCQIGSFRRTGTCYETSFGSSDILNRRTSRLPYGNVAISASLEQSLEGCLSSGERLSYMRGSGIRDLLGPADRNLLDTAPVAREFRRWARLTRAEIANHQDGLSSECLALSTLEARLLSILLSDTFYRWFRRLRLSKMLSFASRQILSHDVQLIALVSQSDEVNRTLDAGRSLMRLWLTLSKLGIYTHPLSQILDFSETYGQLADRIGCASSETIVSIFRFGTSAPPALSPRLSCDTTPLEHGG